LHLVILQSQNNTIQLFGTMPIERSAGAVVFRRENKKNFYLLLHYRAGHWDFPKGNIEKREKPEDTARREIFEETGIEDIEFVLGFKETIKYFYKLRGKTIFKIVVYFLAEAKSKKVKISWEHIGYRWLPYREALERLTFHNAKDMLRKAHQHLTKKFSKTNTYLRAKCK